MLYYLLLCRSLTYAQRASRVLERMGITATITKAPKSAVSQGCTYSVKVSEKNLARSLAALHDAGLGPTRVLLLSRDGSVREVSQ